MTEYEVACPVAYCRGNAGHGGLHDVRPCLRTCGPLRSEGREHDADCPNAKWKSAATGPVVIASRVAPVVHSGYALDLLDLITEPIDLLITDPPYAMGGEGAEHALGATVATTLRELGHQVRKGGWAVVYAASSWRSTYYMVESLRGVLEPVRIGTWCKPVSRSKVRTPGWAWASVNVVAFKRPGRGDTLGNPSAALDHILCAPLIVGRRAQLPPEVARWSVDPFSTSGGLAVDPFAGSGALLDAAADAGMRAVGFDADPLVERPAEAAS